MPSITSFIKHHYRHFNAATLVDAANAYNKLLASGGKMFVTIGGAMSTAELGLSLAERIAREHGATIEVKSHEGAGSKFLVTFG